MKNLGNKIIINSVICGNNNFTHHVLKQVTD